MYQSSHFLKSTPDALALIADTILNPSFLPDEIEAQRDAAFYELREVSAKPEMILPEVLHHVAYGERGLGNPLLCPEDRIGAIDRNVLLSAMKEWYRPERMVIAGVGMQHQELVELVDKYFPSLKSPTPSASSQNSFVRSSQIPPQLLGTQSQTVAKSLTRAASYLFPHPTNTPQLFTTYTGGSRFIHNPEAEFNHLYIAFEGVGIHDDDVYALAIMQVLLGGGGSFSAGMSLISPKHH